MEEIVDFLRRLQAHNERCWFNEHKDEYLKCQAKFNNLVEQLIGEIALFDPSVASNKVADCTYRIYRDTRFSNDKTPYKTHMGAFICPGGKKSGYAGYYFHIGVDGNNHTYPFGHMLATGDYCTQPNVLKTLREDICYGNGDFVKTMEQAPLFQIDKDDALKRNPKGFATDAPYSEYLRLKTFCLVSHVDDEFIFGPNLPQRTAMMFATTKPFLDYINRAITYCRNS